MSNLPQSDLILAGRYVDDDLTSAESAQVESRMKSDSDFAAAVDQIRGQSQLLGSLPKFTPSDDLADRTLQASLDQVKAIMGAWPIESEEQVTLASDVSTNSFDWKSTAAILASLAGLLMIGTMLWQNVPSNESNVAISEAPAVPVMSKSAAASMDKQVATLDDDLESEEESQLVDRELLKTPPSPQAQVARKKSAEFATRNQLPISGAVSGTPMAPPKKSVSGNQLANVSASVDQIWCVKQDRSSPKNSVCDIFVQNRIAVQKEEQPTASGDSESVEAFYVAATPKQMKLAMSQISSNADIEMIQLPNGVDSPIADVIQQQYVQNNMFTEEADIAQSPNENLPPNFQQPAQALAQQLVLNSLPRSAPPSGPVPPILKSGSPIEGLGKSARGDVAAKDDSTAKEMAAAPAPSAGMGGPGGFAKGKEEAADVEVARVESPAQQMMDQYAAPLAQEAELGKYLDDSDQQLRQYLILVRGGGSENR